VSVDLHAGAAHDVCPARHFLLDEARELVRTHARHLDLDEPWWVGLKKGDKSLKAQAFADGIPSLRARGIYLDRRTLESV
jgi:hypothetical protein